MTRLISLSFLFYVFLTSSLSQITWQRYNDNPIISIGPGNIDDPKALRFAYSPSVFFGTNEESDLQIYRMWFSSIALGATAINLSHAISLDGMKWFLYEKNPVLKVGSGGTFDSRWIVNSDVLYLNGEYKMFYSGHDGTRWQTGHAHSRDGIYWNRHQGNPILTVVPGTWESVVCGTPKVYHTGSSYIMIYTGFNGTTYSVGLATSPDGEAWTKYSGNPVLTRGPLGSWDQHSAIGMGLFYSDGTYYLLYGGGPEAPIGIATSTNGINWQKYAGNPVFRPGLPGSWESKVEFGSVLLRNELVHFWYTGNGPGDVWQIGYAVSPFTPSVILSNGSSELSRETAARFELKQAYPSPFNPETSIEYAIPSDVRVVIKIFDTLGNELETIVDERKPTGVHIVRWNASNYASGVYLYRITAGNFTDTKKMVLTK